VPDFDAGFKIVARHAGRELARLAGFDCDAWEPLTGEVQATERLADRVFKARYGGERCVVYMEAYTRWRAAAPWNLLAKSGLLSERERLPTLALVFILLPRGYRSQSGEFRLKLRGETTQQLRYHEVCLVEGDAAAVVGTSRRHLAAVSAVCGTWRRERQGRRSCGKNSNGGARADRPGRLSDAPRAVRQAGEPGTAGIRFNREAGDEGV
jgi:hypothetical protein